MYVLCMSVWKIDGDSGSTSQEPETSGLSTSIYNYIIHFHKQ